MSSRHFLIEDLACRSQGRTVLPSSNGGVNPGSTIVLPWGFLQAHHPGKESGPYQLQFHHDLDDIDALMRLA
jgi:hypothetical protein